MSDLFQIASVAMAGSRQRLEAISSNAAGASLPGYRRHVTAGDVFDAVLAGTAQERRGDRLERLTTRIGVNLQTAAAKATGRALDVAIEAPDLFFALSDGEQLWLTRAGSFELGPDGALLGEHGLRVVGPTGDVHLPGSDVEIAADGSITHHGVLVATLQLFRPDDAAALRAGPGSLLSAPTGVQPVAAGEGRVRGGMLEASNTDAAREMLDLIGVSRQFEALSRVVQSYDQLLGRVIERLGGG